MIRKVIARSFLIGMIGVSFGIILAVSGISIKIVNSKSDWKTYTNREFLFSFRYPADWNFYREEKGKEITIRVSDSKESFSVVMRGQSILAVQSFSRRVVIAQRNALVIDRTAHKSTKIYREAYFYEPDSFHIAIMTDSGIPQPRALEVFRTFKFLD